MITVIQFTAEHVHQLRKLYPDEALGVGPDPDAFVKQLEVEGLAFTVIEDGQPIGCAGILPLWKGAGEAWALFSPRMIAKPFFLHRTVKKYLYRLQEKGRFHRVQCAVLYNFRVGCNWIRRLGFISEGPLYMFCPNKLNYRRFVLLANY